MKARWLASSFLQAGYCFSVFTLFPFSLSVSLLEFFLRLRREKKKTRAENWVSDLLYQLYVLFRLNKKQWGKKLIEWFFVVNSVRWASVCSFFSPVFTEKFEITFRRQAFFYPLLRSCNCKWVCNDVDELNSLALEHGLVRRRKITVLNLVSNSRRPHFLKTSKFLEPNSTVWDIFRFWENIFSFELETTYVVHALYFFFYTCPVVRQLVPEKQDESECCSFPFPQVPPSLIRKHFSKRNFPRRNFLMLSFICIGRFQSGGDRTDYSGRGNKWQHMGWFQAFFS